MELILICAAAVKKNLTTYNTEIKKLMVGINFNNLYNKKVSIYSENAILFLLSMEVTFSLPGVGGR